MVRVRNEVTDWFLFSMFKIFNLVFLCLEDCLTVSESLKECLRQISDSIRACQSKLDESKSIAKMILLELKESPMVIFFNLRVIFISTIKKRYIKSLKCLLEDSKITGQMSKRPRRTLISNALPTKRLLQVWKYNQSKLKISSKIMLIIPVR